MTDIVIPVQAKTRQLDKTLDLLAQHAAGHKVWIVEEPRLNVSDARQKALDELPLGNRVCFMDDDSETLHDGWLEAMENTMDEHPDAGAVFGGEWWGTEPQPEIVPVPGDTVIEYGPAACMLLDKRRLPPGLKWDPRIGLRSGWLGGDFEEVDYCYRLRSAGLNLYRCTRSLFHHVGGKTTHIDFQKTDRARCIQVMNLLIRTKYQRAPDDEDWFKGLEYLAADPNNDCNFANDGSVRRCYAKVVRRNGLRGHPEMIRLGLL